MAICYFDDYQRVDSEWLFRRRKEKHWYAADISEHPQAVGFDSWNTGGPPPALPDAVVEATAARYREAYERVCGRSLADWPGAA